MSNFTEGTIIKSARRHGHWTVDSHSVPVSNLEATINRHANYLREDDRYIVSVLSKPYGWRLLAVSTGHWDAAHDEIVWVAFRDDCTDAEYHQAIREAR